MLANDHSLYVLAYAHASVPFSLAGTNTANSQADENSIAQVHIYSGVNICASNHVSLVAQTDFAETNSHAKTETTGLTAPAPGWT